MHFLFYNLTSNSSKKKIILFLPVQRQPRGLQHLNLEAKSKILIIGKLHPKRKLFCTIIYPLTPKTKPIITVYAEVSEPLPPLFLYLRDKIKNENDSYARKRFYLDLQRLGKSNNPSFQEFARFVFHTILSFKKLPSNNTLYFHLNCF